MERIITSEELESDKFETILDHNVLVNILVKMK